MYVYKCQIIRQFGFSPRYWRFFYVVVNNKLKKFHVSGIQIAINRA